MDKFKKGIAVLLCTLMLGIVINVNIPEDVCSTCGDIVQHGVVIE